MPASDQGVNLERYMLVPRTLIFITRDDNILLLKGASTKRLWPGLYNGIGGHVEPGEDILSAARRELLEETGLSQSTLWLCGIMTVDTQTNPGVCVYIFKGETSQSKIKHSKEGSLEWVHIPEMSQLPLVPDLPYSLPKILEMKFGEPPFFAHSSYNEAGNPEITFA